MLFRTNPMSYKNKQILKLMGAQFLMDNHQDKLLCLLYLEMWNQFQDQVDKSLYVYKCICPSLELSDITTTTSTSSSNLAQSSTSTKNVSKQNVSHYFTILHQLNSFQWKKLKGLGGLLPGESKDKYDFLIFIYFLLSIFNIDFGIIELSIIKGRNLVAMDRNGKQQK